MKNIHISNDGQSSSLRVNWTPGQGDVDRYAVSLSQTGGQAKERSDSKHVNEISFQDLLPGQQYMITVTSVSGSLINNSTATGRTGKVIHLYMVFFCCFCHVNAVVL